MALIIDVYIDAWSPEARAAALRARQAHANPAPAAPARPVGNIVTRKSPQAILRERRKESNQVQRQMHPHPIVVTARSPKAIAKERHIANIPHGVNRNERLT